MPTSALSAAGGAAGFGDAMVLPPSILQPKSPAEAGGIIEATCKANPAKTRQRTGCRKNNHVRMALQKVMQRRTIQNQMAAA
jgi:hypothetical protein